MTILQLAEPLFQYVCRLNRIARRSGGPKAALGDTSFFTRTSGAAAAGAPKAPAPGAPAAAATPPTAAARGANLDYVVARSEIKALFEDMMSRASTDMRLSQQARKVELPLIFFVDSMISEGSMPFAAEWNQNRLAYDRQELAGDEKFFDLLDETLKDTSEDAAERLAIFYTCMGLGFTGIYFKQPEFLRKTMLSIAPRIRHLVENDQSAKICPEAYEGVDTRNLVEPPSSRMAFVGLLFAGVTAAVVISYLVMYWQASRNLNHSIEEVLKQDLAADQSK
jgi:type VI secretion system protein ImpK